MIRRVKIIPPRSHRAAIDEVMDLQADMRSAVLQGFRIVQYDETMVTRTTIPKLDWSHKFQNSEVDYSQLNRDPIAIVAAVSRERGLELAMQFPKSVNVTKFKVFLDELRRINPYDNILLIGDQLSVHRNHTVKSRIDDLSFRLSFTPRYSPDYNGIESVFSMVKDNLKRQRLYAIMNNKRVNLNYMISKAFNELCPHKVAKCVAKSLELLGIDDLA